MSPISRGFQGPPRQADAARLPPSRYLEHGFPVLSAGPTPRTPLDEWTLVIRGAVDEPVSWTWDELLTLPAETPTVDIHCDLWFRTCTSGRAPSGCADWSF
jgi:DMSO/TMAO reductase YedYZ molybdopterin-dependent catalytic subunit